VKEKRVLAVVSHEELVLQRRAWKDNANRVVCVVGAFDLLHPGHVRLLEQAKELGDVLVVGVLNDEWVRRNLERERPGGSKGRPVNPEADRAEVVAALAAVDAVTISNDSIDVFAQEFSPNLLVIGGTSPYGTNLTPAPPVDPSAPDNHRVVPIPLEPGFSTSLLIERIAQLNA